MFTALHEQLQNSMKRDIFFDESAFARSVLLDMEPKVVQNCLSVQKGWSYRPESAYWKQSGSGNNWAFGFNEYGPHCRDEVLNILRREAERCDRLDSLMILKSTAGGTGSGVGAYFSQETRDIFDVSLVSVEMWPFRSGEVCVQSYNTLLSLASSHETADLLIIFQNSDLSHLAQKRLAIKNPSFSALNEIAATHLTHQLLPGNLSATVAHLTACPFYKMSTVRFVPQTYSKHFATDHTSALIKGLARMQQTRSVIDLMSSKEAERNLVFASQLCLKGLKSSDTSLTAFRTLRESVHYWNNSLDPLRLITSSDPFLGLQTSASTLSVDQTCLAGMSDALFHATDMFRSRAFVHQYEKFGINDAAMLSCIHTVDELVRKYSDATI